MRGEPAIRRGVRTLSMLIQASHDLTYETEHTNQGLVTSSFWQGLFRKQHWIIGKSSAYEYYMTIPQLSAGTNYIRLTYQYQYQTHHAFVWRDQRLVFAPEIRGAFH